MGRINIEASRPGMRVKADAKNSEGMLLIPAGCVLSEKHIDLLMTWGVPTLEIDEGETEPTVEELLRQAKPEEVAIWKAEIEEAFLHYEPENPVMQELFRQMLLRKARQHQKNNA